jgi:hypothetical protein
MSDDRVIVLEIVANGKPIMTASDSPLRGVRIDVTTQGPDGKREVALHFELNLDGTSGGTHASPHVKGPR